MPLLSSTFQVDLRNFCGDGWKGLPLLQIRDMFDAAGVKPSSPENLPPSGQRRALTNHYLNVIDWESEEDITKVLKAVSIALFSKKTSAEHKAALRELCEREGLWIGADKVTLPGRSGPGVKNLIFASIGYKPEIVLIDATTNEIQITRNAEYCLVYDRSIEGSLLWCDLVDWWMEHENATATEPEEAEEELYECLERSLDSEPEKMLMRAYFDTLRPVLDDKLPALVPQVYLHYDPYTFKARGDPGPLARQRMDFLLLLSSGRRVVLEIDGKQHYSDGNQSSPRLYAAMMAEDRRLKLTGYEVFRFGGQEFVDKSQVRKILSDFFIKLFTMCGYEVK
jgi:hypothetical protein